MADTVPDLSRLRERFRDWAVGAGEDHGGMTRRAPARNNSGRATIAHVALLVLTACTSAPASSGAMSPTPALVARQPAYVVTTDGRGADFHRAPGPAGERIRVLPDGAVLEATGREQRVDERTWTEARDSVGTVGWIPTDLLSSAPPPLPTPTPLPVILSPPPVPIPVPIPAVQVTAGPRPTDTLIPLAPPRQASPLPALPTAPPPRPMAPATPIPIAPPRELPTFPSLPTPTARPATPARTLPVPLFPTPASTDDGRTRPRP